MNTRTLPDFREIESYSDERLLSIIKSGESIGWKIGLGESTGEIEDYMMMLYSELEFRNLTKKP